MAVSSLDGTISSSDFCAAASAFVERWKMINTRLPPWSWVPYPESPWIASNEVKGYLSLESVCLLRFNEEKHEEASPVEKQESCCDETVEPMDKALLVQRYGHDAHYYDFHIVYSTIYRVPVLFFRAYYNDGQTLVLDDIQKDLPFITTKVLMETKWTFITQEEHPYLHRPWYTLHPCGTSKWMNLLFLSDASAAIDRVPVERYLVSWLSVVGQVVGLKVPLEMLKHSSQMANSSGIFG